MCLLGLIRIWKVYLQIGSTLIELYTSIPPTHQTKYKLNPNYAITIKHDIDKLLTTWFIQLIEEVTWLSPIVVMLKNNGKLKICVD